MAIKGLANWDNEYHMARMRTGVKANMLAKVSEEVMVVGGRGWGEG